MKKLQVLYILIFFLIACRHRAGKQEKTPPNTNKKEHKSIIKPPTIFSDTLRIDSKVAVFYYPDSIQLKTIKAGLDSSIFDASMHEYSYQLRYTHQVLNKYWPAIKIIEAKNVRYLVFIKADKNEAIVDLDTKYDPYGLLVFDPGKDPVQLDMTNAESQIGFYFADATTPQTSK